MAAAGSENARPGMASAIEKYQSGIIGIINDSASAAAWHGGISIEASSSPIWRRQLTGENRHQHRRRKAKSVTSAIIERKSMKKNNQPRHPGGRKRRQLINIKADNQSAKMAYQCNRPIGSVISYIKITWPEENS